MASAQRAIQFILFSESKDGLHDSFGPAFTASESRRGGRGGHPRVRRGAVQAHGSRPQRRDLAREGCSPPTVQPSNQCACLDLCVAQTKNGFPACVDCTPRTPRASASESCRKEMAEAAPGGSAQSSRSARMRRFTCIAAAGDFSRVTVGDGVGL